MPVLYFFLATLPLIIFPSGNQVYEMAKFVWLLMGVGVFALVRAREISERGNLVLYDKHIPRQMKYWFVLATVYLVYLVVNTAVSLSPEVSFFGNYVRHGGLLSVCALVLLLWLLLSKRTTKKEEELILLSIVTGGTMAAMTGVIQRFLLFVQDVLPEGVWLDIVRSVEVMGSRVFGSMGHPNFLGQLLVATILLSVVLILRNPTKYLRMFLSSGVLLQLIALGYTWNRASFIALIIGLLAIYIVHGWYTKKKWHRWGALALLLCTVIGIVGYLFVAFANVEERSLSSRSSLFPRVLDLIQSNPWVGFGLDSFGYAFSPYIPVELYETENFSQLPDKAHNDILDTIVEQGIIGFMLISSLMIWLLKMVLAMPNGEKKYRAVVYSVILIAMEISNQAGFATTVHKVVMIVLLALIIKELLGESVEKKTASFSRYALILLGGILIFTGIRFGIADTLYTNAFATKNDATYRLALDVAPINVEYKLFGKSALPTNEEQLEVLSHAYTINPYDIYAPLFLAKIYGEQKDIEKTKEYLEQAGERCGVCSDVPYYGAFLMSSMDQQDRAKEYAQRYLDLLPSFMNKPLEALSAYEKERRRIFTKEQGKRLEEIRRMVEQ